MSSSPSPEGPGCGRYCLEQAPEEILEALAAFLAPYRDGPAATPDPGRRAVVE